MSLLTSLGLTSLLCSFLSFVYFILYSNNHVSHNTITVPYYPNLLTYDPHVDCYSGRYLIAPMLEDGLGNSVASYASVINFAIIYNLTIIDGHEWYGSKVFNHAQDEEGFARAQYFGTSHFQVSRTEYDACHPDSPVKRHQFVTNKNFSDIHNFVHSNNERPPSIKLELDKQIKHFIQRYPKSHTIVFPKDVFLERGTFFRAGEIIETRYNTIHRQQPQQSLFQLTRTMPQNALPMVTTIVKPNLDAIRIAVHIRRNDKFRRDEQNSMRFHVNGAFGYIVLNNDAFLQIIGQLLSIFPTHLRSRIHLTLYSEGLYSDFNDFLNTLSLPPYSISNVGCLLNGPTTTTFDLLIQSHILIADRSSFSYAAGAFNSKSLKIAPQYSESFFGLRNYIQATCENCQAQDNQFLDEMKPHYFVHDISKLSKMLNQTLGNM